MDRLVERLIQRDDATQAPMLQGPCMRRNDDAVHQQLHVGGRQVARAYAIRGACFDKPVGVEFELLHLLDVFGLERLGLAVGQQHGLLVGGHDARVGIDGAVQARDGIFDAQQGRRHFFLVALDDVLQRQEQQVLLVRHVLVHQAEWGMLGWGSCGAAVGAAVD
ncbi:Uncharacterised protein [Bordetella pertussis]|nr:Uncharacterised protein [Bordetella pertussis]